MSDVEEWKPCFGYEGIYEVSSFGNVRNMAGLILKPAAHGSKRNYLAVGLCKNGKQSTKLVHRLVLQSFLGDQPDKSGNHINGDGFCNKLENLEWATWRENVSHHYMKRTGKGFGLQIKPSGRYQLKVYKDGKTKHIGNFDTQEQGREAYIKWARENGIENKYLTGVENV